MKENQKPEPRGTEDVAELLNRGVESLALLLALVDVLKAKGIVTDHEVGEMGKKAEQLRVEILEGHVPS